MFVQPRSTRHTKIGTLRMGVIYSLDEKDRRVAAAIEPLLAGDTPVLERLTDKEAKKRKSEVASLVPKAEAKATSAVQVKALTAENADLAAKVESLEAELADPELLAVRLAELEDAGKSNDTLSGAPQE